MDPDQKGMVGTLYPSALQTPAKGFGLGPLMTQIWAFFQILEEFQIFYFRLQIAMEHAFFIGIMSKSQIMCKSMLEKKLAIFFFLKIFYCRAL